MTHNLPKCFKITPDKEVMKIPNMVRVTFDHKTNIEDVHKEMHIKLEDNAFCPDPNATTMIKVKFLQESKSGFESEALECKVCVRLFSEDNQLLIPRVLPACGHTLCQGCVDQLKNSGQVPCPYDRKTSQINNQETFPKNHAIIDLLREKKDLEKMAEMAAIPLCEDPDVPCFENPKHEATCYCASCKAEFCENCFTSTHDAKIFSNHESVSIEEKPVELPNCTVHLNKLARYVCKEASCKLEQKLFCDKCLSNTHKSHAHGNLSDNIRKNQDELSHMVLDSKNSECRLVVKLENTQEYARSFERTTLAYAKKVDSINKYFDEKKEEALKRFGGYVDAEKEKLELECEEIQNLMGMMTEKRRNIEKMLKQKKNLHDVEEIIGQGTALASLEATTGEGLVPFSSLFIPDDVALENIRKITVTSPST